MPVLLLLLVFCGCDDDTAGVGLGMFPSGDKNINGKLSTFDVTTRSIPTGRIYAKTNLGYVGRFTDELFGTYEAGFLASVNCPDNLTFPGTYQQNALDENGKAFNNMVVDNASDIHLIYDNAENTPDGNPIGNIHTVELYLWYDEYFGDSLTASRLSVYELNDKLDIEDNPYYTDIDPTQFYDEKDLLGSKAYTAVDLSLSDSIRNLSSFVPYVHMELDKDKALKVGGSILRAARHAGSDFDYDKFSDAFKGVYVKNDYGDGTILYVFQVQLNVVYKCYAVDETTGVKLKKNNSSTDSTFYAYRSFTSTREVVQANRLESDNEKIKQLIDEDNNTYIKSPAGIFTEATLPINEIQEELAMDSLNAVRLTFSNYNMPLDQAFGMSVPSTLLLVRKEDKDRFFEENQLADDVTSFLTTHSSTVNQYTFGNITTLINDCLTERESVRHKIEDEHQAVTIEVTDDEGNVTTETVSTIEEWEEKSGWDKVVLIPVLVTYDSSSSSSAQIIGVQHDLAPSYVRLKGGERGLTDPAYRLKLEVISTNFGN